MLSDRKRLLIWTVGSIAGLFLILIFVGALLLPDEYHFKTEMIVPKPPIRAWAWFVDPEHWNKRLSMIENIEGPSKKLLEVGDRRRIVTIFSGGNKLTTDVLVTNLIKGKLYSDRHLGNWLNNWSLPVSNVKDQLEFEPEGKDKTRIIIKGRFEVDGPFDKWIAYLMLKPEVDRFMANIQDEYHRSIENNNPRSLIRGG